MRYNNVFDLIADSIIDEWTDVPADIDIGVCAVTGAIDVPCVPIKKLVSSNFVGWNVLKAPGSDMVSLGVYQVLKYRPQRASSWFVSLERGFEKLKRADIKPHLFGRSYSTEWAAYVTTSYKKHGAFKAVLNDKSYGIWAFDDMLIDCSDIEKVSKWYARLDEYIHAGIGRKCLESATVNKYAIQKAGLRIVNSFLEWATPRVNSPLYKFLCYLLPSIEDLKNE